jgi:hypothetical protein
VNIGDRWTPSQRHDPTQPDIENIKMKTTYQLSVIAVVLLTYISLPGPAMAESGSTTTAVDKPHSDIPAYVGIEICASCHQEESINWRGSQHDLAMQHANDKTVLGNFDNASFEYNGIKSTFFRKQGLYYINTDGPDGKLSDFLISYTFGVTPLQQYLVELDGGRLQALSIAWDSRTKADGGQRWFHLYPDEKIDYKDELHWTRQSQNWNFMCAECHSTNLKKNFDLKTNQFHTTWSEIDVSCEACHGPGSRHVAWANKTEDRENSGDKGLVI